VGRRRSAITLAKSALGNDALARIMASIGDDESDLGQPASAPVADIAPAIDLALA
jgi:hypothetical protein